MRYRSYWISSGGLLTLTLLMLMTETVPLYHTIALMLLLVAMLIKATVIAAWFMHLRVERALVASVVGATMLTGIVLFGLIVPDGIAVLTHDSVS